jgi:peptide/nickel transport system ATP-binding protein
MRRELLAGAPLLSIRNLNVTGEVDGVHHPILRDISLDLQHGEVLGLIGESGAGKSTIGLAAIGIFRPGCRITGGSIEFDGVDLVRSPDAVTRKLRGTRIAYVAQSAAASFNPAYRLLDQTIETTVINAVETRTDATRRAIALYRQLQLPDPENFGKRFPHQVSGGQLQRAIMAMAMMSDPDLIVFDEPTTALDVTTQIEVLVAIRDLIATRDLSAIYITHDLALVSQIATRIMVLKNGETVEEAPTRTMLTAPREEYTKSLWAVRNLSKDAVSESTILLRIANVSAGYAKQQVLHNVTIDVASGHTVAVVGESGSGKSTLGRTVAGLLAPSGGTIEFEGETLADDYRARDRSLLQRIQMIYQSADTALNPRQTVRKIIGRPLQIYGALRGDALERESRKLLRLVELQDRHFDRFPSELSGGEKQRVAIARAIAAKPDLIICDEVTSALDQIVKRDILQLLMRLQRELGVAYILITHDIETVRAIADEVVVMHRGVVVEQGNKNLILQPPHAPYTDLLLSSVPQLDAAWLTNLLANRNSNRSQPFQQIW